MSFFSISVSDGSDLNLTKMRRQSDEFNRSHLAGNLTIF